ncbi:MAG: hypothetical protein AAFX81_05840 [Pseudomonadota bacterium]
MPTAPFNLQDFDFTFGPDVLRVVEPSASPVAGSTFPAIFNGGFVNALPGSDVIHGSITGFESADDVDFVGFSNSGVLLTSFGSDRVSGTVSFEQAFPGDFSGEGNGINGGGNGLVGTGFGDDAIAGTVSVHDTGDQNPTLLGFALRGIILMTGPGSDTVGGMTSFSSKGPASVGGRGINDAIVFAGTGADSVHGAVEARSPAGLAITEDGLTGLRASTLIMGFGDDTVSGEATVSGALQGAPSDVVDIGGIRSSNLLLGAGDDHVVAKVTVDSHPTDGSNDVDADGIRSSTIAWGAGADRIDSSVDVESTGSAFVNGLRSTSIGDGRFGPKTIDVDVSATGTGLGVEVNGLLNTTATLGRANDDVTVDADATGAGHNDVVAAVGMFGGSIDSGNGTDHLTFAATARGDASLSVTAAGLLGASVTGGLGVDQVEANAAASGDDAFAAGISDSNIDTAGNRGNAFPFGGDDLVLGDATATGKSAAARAITNTDVRTGNGADAVTAEADATSHGPGGSALAAGIVGEIAVGVVTGRGNDNVCGMATAEASGLGATAVAFGIVGSPFIGDVLVSTGAGSDTVIASGMASADGIGSSARGVGIAFARIETGAGVDEVQARGSTLGVDGVHIDTGRGRDFLDLQSGNGFVDGGRGFDTLILQGSRADFDFDVIDFDTVEITDAATNGDVTDLTVTRVERFEFDDGLTSLGDILMV